MFKVEIKKDGILTNYAEFQTSTQCDDWILENHDYFPEEYSFEVLDITADLKVKNRLLNAKKRIEFGAELIAEIISINEYRLESGTLTEQDFIAMLSDTLLGKIERLLWNGSIATAKSLISAMGEEHYSAEQKQMIINKMDLFLTSITE